MPKGKKPSAESLEHYREVSLYETAFKNRREDVDCYLRLAAGVKGPILEYGAGAGRVTLPLARAGHEIWAVDASAPMLQRLRTHLEKAPREVRDRISCIRGDMRRYETSARFELILATFNVVAHLATYKDFGLFLKKAREHLAPGGRLVFDVPIPHADEVEADPEELFPAPRFKHPDTGEWIRQTERFAYDPSTQMLLVESQFRAEGGRDTLTVPLVLRQWFPKEVEAILGYEGFSRVETLADYSENPGMLAQDTLVFIASKN
jgi:SAM-dependent methyltransferase